MSPSESLISTDLEAYWLPFTPNREFEARPRLLARASGFDVYLKCFERGLLVRQTGDIIALSPPLIVERSHIEQMFGTLSEVLRAR